MLFAYNSRYGYDYGGGYDRGGSGSRGGYGDERPHGRYMNHPSGNCEVSTLSSRLWTSINIKIVQIQRYAENYYACKLFQLHSENS